MQQRKSLRSYVTADDDEGKFTGVHERVRACLCGMVLFIV